MNKVCRKYWGRTKPSTRFTIEKAIYLLSNEAYEPIFGAKIESMREGRVRGNVGLSLRCCINLVSEISPIPEQKAPSGISLEGAFLQVIPDYGLASP
jgi:hypothetical protein